MGYVMFSSVEETFFHRTAQARRYHWCIIEALAAGITDAFHGLFVEDLRDGGCR